MGRWAKKLGMANQPEYRPAVQVMAQFHGLFAKRPGDLRGQFEQAGTWHHRQARKMVREHRMIRGYCGAPGRLASLSINGDGFDQLEHSADSFNLRSTRRAMAPTVQ